MTASSTISSPSRTRSAGRWRQAARQHRSSAGGQPRSRPTPTPIRSISPPAPRCATAGCPRSRRPWRWPSRSSPRIPNYAPGHAVYAELLEHMSYDNYGNLAAGAGQASGAAPCPQSDRARPQFGRRLCRARHDPQRRAGDCAVAQGDRARSGERRAAAVAGRCLSMPWAGTRRRFARCGPAPRWSRCGRP